jgi:hypothetical protein
VRVAKVGGLSRDVAFISALMAHRVPFVVAELGSDDRGGRMTQTSTTTKRVAWIVAGLHVL